MRLRSSSQWNAALASGGTFTYPIAFSALYQAICSFNATSSAEKCLFKEASPSSVTKTAFKMNSNTSSIKNYVLVMGK